MIIAEIGLNHLGSEKYLDEYLENLLKSSVDAVTLQIREKNFYVNSKYSEYQLSLDVYDSVCSRVKASGKKFGMALSDLSLASFFNERVDFYKILSKDLGDEQFIEQLINVVNKPFFVSTGLSSYEAIECFISEINPQVVKNLTLIHTRLSNKVEDTNLKAIQNMKLKFEMPIAFGNHCENPLVTYAALAYNPTAIFLYTKGDRVLNHPDEKHAISLSKIVDFSKNIKQVSKSIGNGHKEDLKNIIEGQK